jgi:hypothetical protein
VTFIWLPESPVWFFVFSYCYYVQFNETPVTIRRKESRYNRLKALGELELPGEDSTVAADSSLAVTASLDA